MKLQERSRSFSASAPSIAPKRAFLVKKIGGKRLFGTWLGSHGGATARQEPDKAGSERGEPGEGHQMTLRAVEVAVAFFQEHARSPCPGMHTHTHIPHPRAGGTELITPGRAGNASRGCWGGTRGAGSPREGAARREGRVPGQELRAERGRCVVRGVFCVCGPAEPRSSVQRLLTAC